MNGQNIYYEIHGGGEPVVFISGLTMNRIPWSLYQVPTFNEAGFQCILIDNRDVGKSSLATDSYTIHDMSNDVVGVLETAGIDSAHVIGYSMGGMIALDMAVSYPKRVRSLSVVGITGKQGASEKNLLTVVVAAKARLSNEEFWRLMASKVMTWRFFERIESVTRWFDFVTSEAYFQSYEALQRQAEACSVFDIASELHKITQPTYIIVGEEDEMLAPRHSQFLAQNIDQAMLSSIECAGHAVYSEAVDQFNPVVLNFYLSIRKKPHHTMHHCFQKYSSSI